MIYLLSSFSRPDLPRKQEQRYLILNKLNLPRRSRDYLPGYTEHKIQEDPNGFIDDPSSIFFDPDEKSGFVYKALPRYTYQVQQPDEDIHYRGKGSRRKNGYHRISPDSSIDFDDSLDAISNIPTTPSILDASFDRNFDMSSRRPSIDDVQNLSYEDEMRTGHIYTVNTLSAETPPIGLLYGTDEHISPQLANLRLYEDPGYSSGGNRHNNRKDNYNSDAESTKTYQDSGIYEDEVFIDSPKDVSDPKLGSSRFPPPVDLKMEGTATEPPERLSAFKTPNSSPLGSAVDSEYTLSSIKGLSKQKKGEI